MIGVGCWELWLAANKNKKGFTFVSVAYNANLFGHDFM